MKPTQKRHIINRRPKTHKHKCVVCGRGFKSSRSHTRLCSPRCRQTLHRRQRQRTIARASTATRFDQ
jgi:predicted nucleic acid-binding Zn ribbon protein